MPHVGLVEAVMVDDVEEGDIGEDRRHDAVIGRHQVVGIERQQDEIEQARAHGGESVDQRFFAEGFKVFEHGASPILSNDDGGANKI
jgi:hypothetical protein